MRTRILALAFLATLVLTVQPVNAAETVLDTYSTVNQDAFFSPDTSYDAISWSTDPSPENMALYRIELYLRKGGNPAGTLFIALYPITGSHGTTAIPIGSPYATSNGFDVTVLNGFFTLYNLTFPSPYYTLSSDRQYAIVLDTTRLILNPEAGDGVDAGADSSAPTHPGNAARRQIADGAWLVLSNFDMVFTMYGRPPQETFTGGSTGEGSPEPSPESSAVGPLAGGTSAILILGIATVIFLGRKGRRR